MKGKIALIFSVTASLILLSLLASGVNAAVEHSTYTDLFTDSKGVKTVTIYSGIRNVLEDGKWKPIEEAKSLMGKGFNVSYLQNDGVNDFNVIDFNLTSITFKVISSNVSASSVTYKQNGNVAGSKLKGDTVTIVDTNIMSDNFSVGDHSTTISITNAGDGVRDDGYTDANSKTTVISGGIGTSIQYGQVGASEWLTGVVKFNINNSYIPSGVTILDATAWLYVSSVGGGTNWNISVWGLSNQTWYETNASDNVWYLSTTTGSNVTLENYTGSHATGWNPYNVTKKVAWYKSQGFDNASFFFNTSWTGNSTNAYLVASSKEGGVIVQRPQLNITYTTSPPTAIYDAATATINITGYATCASILSDINNAGIVKSCTSPFASTCISVNASINVTDSTTGGNLMLNNCELQFSQTSNNQFSILNNGNLTIIKSNLTTNDTNLKWTMTVAANSRHTSLNSFYSFLSSASFQTPIFSHNNNTFYNITGKIQFTTNTNGSVISNFTLLNASGSAIVELTSVSNFSIKNMTINYSYSNIGLKLNRGNNNTIYGLAVDNMAFTIGGDVGVYNFASDNNTFNYLWFSNFRQVGSAVNYGMDNDISKNTTITNFGVKNMGSFGVGLYNRELAAGYYFQNGTITSLKYGIWDSGSGNGTVSYVTVSNSTTYGIWLQSSYNAINNSNFSYNYQGVLVSGDLNLFNGVTANSNTKNGFYVVSQSNKIYNSTASFNGQNGVYISGGVGNLVNNVTAASNTIGIALDSQTNNSVILNSNASNNIGSGVQINAFQEFEQPKTSFNNTISGVTAVANAIAGMSLYYTTNNTFYANNVSRSGFYGYYLFGSNNMVFNGIYSQNSGVGVWLEDISSNNTFVNSTYENESVLYGGSLNRAWFMDFFVNSSTGVPMTNANVTFYNSSAAVTQYASTNSTGWIPRQTLFTYMDMAGAYFYDNNYTVVAWNFSYAINRSTFNLTGNILDKNGFLQLASDTVAPSISPITRDPPCLEINNHLNISWLTNDSGSDVASYNCSFISTDGKVYNISTIFPNFLSLSTSNYQGWCDLQMNATGTGYVAINVIDRSNNVNQVNYFYLVRDYASCSGGQSGSGGNPSGGSTSSGSGTPPVTIITGKSNFDVLPKDIVKLVNAGESLFIAATSDLNGTQHTFLIRNDAPVSIHLEIAPQGDYKNYIFSNSSSSEVEIKPGQTVPIDFYTRVPNGTLQGSYQIVITFKDKYTGISGSSTITLVYSPLSAFTEFVRKIISALLIPLNAAPDLKTQTNFATKSIDIYSSTTFSFPVGFLFFALLYAVMFYPTRVGVNYAYTKSRTRDKTLLLLKPIVYYGIPASLLIYLMWII